MSVPTNTEKVLTKGDDHKRRHRSRSKSSSDRHHRRDRPKEINRLIITESTVGILVPNNADFAEVLLVGGGGGGGASGRGVPNIPQYAGGGGGGGGAYVKDKLCLKGGTMDVKIGAGGLLGENAGTNGQDGGDTVLFYRHYCKTAHGGLGGLGSFNGSFGGKGGKGGGKGNDGDDGFTNINSLVPGANLQGAYGGLSGLCEPTTYGNGGKGEDQTDLGPQIMSVPMVVHMAAPTSMGVTHFIPPFVPGRSGNVNPSLTFGGGPFGSGTFIPQSTIGVAPAASTQATIITEPATVTAPSVTPMTAPSVTPMTAPSVTPMTAPSVTPMTAPSVTPMTAPSVPCENKTPAVYNESNNGTPGYCKIVFYSYCDNEAKPCKESKYSKITIKDPLSLYLVNPNVSTTEVDTSNFPARLSLGKPCGKYKKVTIKLMYQNGMNAYLMLVTGGTFLLSPANPNITLIYEHCTWNIIDNLENVLSYYPTVQKGDKLIPYDSIPPSGFSVPSIAISADGNTLAFGEPDDDGGIGAVWIYVKRDCRWARRAKLIGNDYSGSPVYQGCSVALSADGKTVAFGGYGDNTGTGAVWVFQCINGDWIQQGSKLTNPTSNNASGLGYAIDMSADGNTLIVGESNNPVINEGNGLIFTRSGDVWSLETNLVGTPNSSSYYQGLSVAISADGNTVALGSNADTIWMFVKDLTTNTWVQDGPPLTGPSGSYFGISVSLSANGLRLATGLPFYNSFLGGVAVFNKVGGVWLQDGLPLYSPEAPPNSYQGVKVELSADGNTLIFSGNNGSPTDEGFMVVYIYQDGNWVPAQQLIDGVPTDYTLIGMTPSLSSDGSTLAAATFPLPGDFSYVITYE